MKSEKVGNQKKQEVEKKEKEIRKSWKSKKLGNQNSKKSDEVKNQKRRFLKNQLTK